MSEPPAASAFAASPDGDTTTHVVVLMHGIDGEVKDMHAVKAAILEKQVPGLDVFTTPCNHGKTHRGVQECAQRFWDALQPELQAKAALTSGLRVSFVGHSMGGLVLRRVATLLHNAPNLCDKVILETIVCIASPHLGCRLLGCGGRGGVAPLMVTFGPSLMRAGLRLIKGATVSHRSHTRAPARVLLSSVSLPLARRALTCSSTMAH